MTLKEYLKQNFSQYCYKAAPMMEREKGNKLKTVAEVWLIPIGILNQEIKIK